MSDDFGADVQAALDTAVQPMDREWVSDRFEVPYQIAPYQNLLVVKSGGVTVHYPLDMPQDERTLKKEQARADLKNDLIREAFAEMRELIAEWKLMQRELAEQAGFDQSNYGSAPAPIPGPGNPARQPNPPAARPAPKADAPRDKSVPVDWGFVKYAVKADQFGHLDRMAVPVQEYSFDGERLTCYQTGAQFGTGSVNFKRNEDGSLDNFWTRVFGNWEPQVKTPKNRGKLSNSYIVLLMEGSPEGKVNGKGNPWQNVVGKLTELPGGLQPASLPRPDSVKPVPIDRGSLSAYFDKSEAGDDEWGSEYDDAFDSKYYGNEEDIPF